MEGISKIPPNTFYCVNCESTNGTYSNNMVQCYNCFHRWRYVPPLNSLSQRNLSLQHEDHFSNDDDHQDDEAALFDQHIFDWMEDIPMDALNKGYAGAGSTNSATNDTDDETATLAITMDESVTTALDGQANELRDKAPIPTITIPHRRSRKKSVKAAAANLPLLTKDPQKRKQVVSSPITMEVQNAPRTSTSVGPLPLKSNPSSSEEQPPNQSTPSSSEEQQPSKESTPSTEMTTSISPLPNTPPSQTDSESNTLFIPKRRRIVNQPVPSASEHQLHQQPQSKFSTTSRSSMLLYSSYSSSGHLVNRHLATSPFGGTTSHDKHHDTTTFIPLRSSENNFHAHQQPQQQARFPASYQSIDLYSCTVPYSRYVSREDSPLYTNRRVATRRM